MELRQLRHFITLAEEMHFGRAAERLSLSQPALSTSIHRLEEEFGVRLFERGSRSVRMTPAGDLMLGSARQTLNQADRTKGFSRALSEGRVGRIEVGLSGTMLSPELDQLLMDCRSAFPEIEIYLREITSQKQVELIRAGRLDAGLVSFPLPPAGLECIELFEDEFVVCLPAKHALASRKIIDIAELREEYFVMQSRERAPNMHNQLVALCTSAGFFPRISFEADHVLSTGALIARGFGVGLVPVTIASAGMTGLRFIPLERPLPRRCWYFAWKAPLQTPGLQALVDMMRTFSK